MQSIWRCVQPLWLSLSFASLALSATPASIDAQCSSFPASAIVSGGFRLEEREEERRDRLQLLLFFSFLLAALSFHLSRSLSQPVRQQGLNRRAESATAHPSAMLFRSTDDMEVRTLSMASIELRTTLGAWLSSAPWKASRIGIGRQELKEEGECYCAGECVCVCACVDMCVCVGAEDRGEADCRERVSRPVF